MQTILARLHRSASAVIWTIGCIAGSAHGADVPPNPFNYARTTSYVYDANGNLRSTTTEPNHADACVVRTLDYDDAGNVKSTTLENCTGAPAIAQFGSRTDLISFAAVPSQQIVVNGASRSVAINAGIFETSSQEPLGHTLSRQYDPRFGAVLQAMEANGLSVVRAVDDFGRVIRETAVDGTSVIHYH